ncbi:hypothetical protein KEM52_005173 [Ascosphaera acerosa]|nr:hypothetical protein KEM52_005173 [Ascosphaera acerosa]
MPYDSDDDDDISITSTVPSEAEENYEFDEIYAESIVRGVKYYLVGWTGYRLDESTWEPLEHFDTPEDALKQWEATKAAIVRGEKEPINFNKIRKQAINREIAAQKRHLRRQAKRKRLGLPVEDGDEIALIPEDFDRWEPEEEGPDDDEPRSQPLWAAIKPIDFRKRALDSSQSIARKTPAKRVILTVSDDEDEEPSRATDKTSTTSGSKNAAKPAPVEDKSSSESTKAREHRDDSQRGRPSGVARKVARNAPASTNAAPRSSNAVAGFPDPAQQSKVQRALAGITARKEARAANAKPRFYTKLSILNRARKAANKDRAPDPNQIELFRAGEAPPPLLSLPTRKRPIDDVVDSPREREPSYVQPLGDFRGDGDVHDTGRTMQSRDGRQADRRDVDYRSGRPPSAPTAPAPRARPQPPIRRRPHNVWSERRDDRPAASVSTQPRDEYGWAIERRFDLDERRHDRHWQRPAPVARTPDYSSNPFLDRRPSASRPTSFSANATQPSEPSHNLPPPTRAPTEPASMRPQINSYELLIHLRSVRKDIGVVKIGALPPSVRTMLSQTGRRGQIPECVLDYWCTIDEYAQLCDQVNNSNMLLAAGKQHCRIKSTT